MTKGPSVNTLSKGDASSRNFIYIIIDVKTVGAPFYSIYDVQIHKNNTLSVTNSPPTPIFFSACCRN
jgi:hypothetical protein